MTRQKETICSHEKYVKHLAKWLTSISVDDVARIDVVDGLPVAIPKTYEQHLAEKTEKYWEYFFRGRGVDFIKVEDDPASLNMVYTILINNKEEIKLTVTPDDMLDYELVTKSIYEVVFYKLLPCLAEIEKNRWCWYLPPFMYLFKASNFRKKKQIYKDILNGKITDREIYFLRRREVEERLGAGLPISIKLSDLSEGLKG